MKTINKGVVKDEKMLIEHGEEITVCLKGGRNMALRKTDTETLKGPVTLEAVNAEKTMKTIMFFLCVLVMLTVGSRTATAAKNTVFVVNSYHQGMQWVDDAVMSIKEVLEETCTIEVFYMDTKRQPAEKFQEIADAVWEKYLEIKPDLVMIGDDNGTRLLALKIAQDGTPVVFWGVNNNPREYHIGDVANITGVLERPLVIRNIVLFEDVLHLKKVLVMFDDCKTSHLVKESFVRNIKGLKEIEVDVYMNSSWEDWKKIVLDLKKNGYDAFFYGSFNCLFQDETLTQDIMDTWITENTPIPPMALWEAEIGPQRAIGGYVMHVITHAREAANMALRFLNGERDIPISQGKKGQFIFSKAQLKKWNIILPEEIKAQAQYKE